MICKNLKELEKELYKRINTALDTDVADTVKEIMTDHIVRDVYDKYEPKLSIYYFTSNPCFFKLLFIASV